MTRSAAEQARGLVGATNVGALATLTPAGDPWGSFVAYATLGDGSPVLCLSRLAEHGRNLAADARASLVIAPRELPEDPLAASRVTLAGHAETPTDPDVLSAARAAYVASVPGAARYVDFDDFSLWVLRIDRIRWVGGYGRMESPPVEAYGAGVNS